jgi:hypothetical protein
MILWAALAWGRDLGDVGYTPQDEVLWVEGTQARVYYSEAGPHQTLLADDDEDGVPDFPQVAADIADEALTLFAEQGFRGLVTPGEALPDVYLVDFASGADGAWRTESCGPDGCSGYLLVDQDFAEGSYGSPEAGLAVVVPHELFHGIQAAYQPDLPGWTSEGTAVWAERLFDPDSADFMGFASAYLALADRPIDRPPSGPVVAFAYGTALFWDFLALRHDPSLIARILEEGGDLDAVEAALAERDDSLGEAFRTFAAWNLAVGARAGLGPSYPYASWLNEQPAEARGPTLDLDLRLYPLAMTVLRLDHPGGPLALSADPPTSEVELSLWGDAEGWSGDAGAPVDLGDWPVGTWWLLATVPERRDQSVELRLCAGPTCADADPEPDPEEEPEACGCQSAPSGSFGWVLFGLLGLRARGGRARSPG